MGRGNVVLGKIGEKIAAGFLSKKGYRVIGKNIRTYLGEIDLVAIKGNEFVFVEVKTRVISSFGPPYLSVTEEKLAHIARSALLYLKTRNALDRRWRVDVVCIEMACGRIKNIELFENVLEEY